MSFIGRKDTRPFTYYNENAYYDASFVQIDRIINDKTVRIKKKKQRNASSKQSKKYLIKWRGLSYEQCTWELLEDLNAFNAEDTRRSVMKYNHLQKLLMERATKHKRDKNSNATTRPSKPAAIDGHLSNLVHLGHGLALKDYQKEGVDWMCYNWHESRSVLLCDEMGLGKTCQTICFLSYLHSIHYIDGPFLVIAPLSTLIHWKREIERFSTMYAVIYQGNKESRAMIFANEFYFDGIYKFNVLIMSYDMVMMEQRRLSKIPFNVMVIDEAHRIKNRECKLYHVLRTFKDPLYKILLTGTPIQNNVDEFWSLLNFVDAEYFNNLDEFVQKYGEITRLEQLDELRGLLGSHVLRRLKCDVEKELLPRTEMVIYVELTKCQKAFYRAVFEKNIAYLRSKSSIKSLRNIAMTLRKICLHPYLLNGAEEEELRRNKIELPPNLKDTLHDDDYANKDAVMQHLVSVSGKFVLCDKLLEKLRREGHKVLIYSQFTSLLDVLEDYLLWKQYEFERIDGSTSLTHRQEAIDHFVENEACFVFLLSTRAGGVGINLIAADTVIIFDSDWNPQNDIQAQSRCHRIGQNKKVSVYRLITRDSYEVYLLECAMKKLVLDDLVMAASTSTTSTTKNKKKDLAQLLKKSAEKLMNPRYDKENEEKMTKFYADDIETILNENTVKIDNVCGNQSIFENLNLSKAMFVPKDADDHELLKMDDPDFWIKLGFGNKISTENTNDFTSVIVSDKSSSNLMRLNEEQNGGKRSRKRTTKYSQFNDDMWGELGSDFEDLTDDDTAKCDSDYDEVEDAKNHCSSDDGIVEEEEDVVMCSNNTNATIAIIPTNPSYLGKTKGAIQIINILDDDEEEECVGKKHKKKKHKKKKHKKKKKKKVVVIDDSGESCNPLSDNFCAVDYLAHRTPLYQVNTINIDKIYQRKGELSTAHFVVGDWKFRVLVYPFGVDNPSYSLMNNSYLSVYLHYLGRADGNKKVDEQIQTEFRCTIHSCLGSQQDLYQELQHKFSIKSKDSFLSGFKNFLPLSLLFRTPFYLFPDPNQSKKEKGKKDKEKAANNAAEETDKERTEKKDKEKENQNVQAADKTKKSEPKRNMAILKTELWVFPPLNWTKAKATPKSPIYIDLLDDDDDEEEEEEEDSKKKKKKPEVIYARTPLHRYCELIKSNLAGFRTLIECGADATLGYGETDATAFFCAFKHSDHIDAAFIEYINTMDNIDLTGVVSEYNDKLLFNQYLRWNSKVNESTISAFVKVAGCDANSADNENDTNSIKSYISNGYSKFNMSIIGCLTFLGANINEADNDGLYPIQHILGLPYTPLKTLLQRVRQMVEFGAKLRHVLSDDEVVIEDKKLYILNDMKERYERFNGCWCRTYS
eukprot:905663_1